MDDFLMVWFMGHSLKYVARPSPLTLGDRALQAPRERHKMADDVSISLLDKRPAASRKRQPVRAKARLALAREFETLFVY
jgi:hypothetical protein